MPEAFERDFTGPTALPTLGAIAEAIPNARHSARAIQGVLRDYLSRGPAVAAARAPVSQRGVEHWVQTFGLSRTRGEAKRFAAVRRMADAVGETCPRRALGRFAADWQDGESYAVLCERYDITSATIARLVRRLRLPERKRRPGQPRRATRERDRRAARARRLADRGMPGREIARTLGVSASSVSAYLRLTAPDTPVL